MVLESTHDVILHAAQQRYASHAIVSLPHLINLTVLLVLVNDFIWRLSHGMMESFQNLEFLKVKLNLTVPNVIIATI